MSAPLVYMWVATFEDGRCLPQFDFETGKENLYRAVKEYPSKLKKLGFYPIPPELAGKVKTAQAISKPLPRYEVVIPKGAEPVILRRNIIKYGLFTGKIKERSIIYLLGWKKDGKYSLMFIDDEGSVEMSDDFNYK